MAARDQRVHRVRADEAGTARDQDPHVTPGFARGGRAGERVHLVLRASPASADCAGLASRGQVSCRHEPAPLRAARSRRNPDRRAELSLRSGSGRADPGRGRGTAAARGPRSRPGRWSPIRAGSGAASSTKPGSSEIHQRLIGAAARRAGRARRHLLLPAPSRTRACDCRKPRPALALRAAAELGFDALRAFVVGDMASDVALGRALGATTLLVRTGHGAATLASGEARADHVVEDLAGGGRADRGAARSGRRLNATADGIEASSRCLLAFAPMPSTLRKKLVSTIWQPSASASVAGIMIRSI